MKKRVLCFGDSNTWGYNPTNSLRYDEEIRWPCVLQSMLGDSFHVIEEGQNGRTFNTDDYLNGYMSGNYYIKPCLKSHDPIDYFILMLGTNDLKKEYGLTVRDIASDGDILLNEANNYWNNYARKKPKVLLLSPPYVNKNLLKSNFSNEFEGNLTIEKSKMFYKELSKIASKNGYDIIDLGKGLNLGKEDGLHLDKEGHRLLAEIVIDWVNIK